MEDAANKLYSLNVVWRILLLSLCQNVIKNLNKHSIKIKKKLKIEKRKCPC